MNLAIALARQERKVLFVDMDLRKPETHKPAYLHGSLGLAGLLSNEVSEEDAILKSPYVRTLSILPGGAANPLHAELITSAAMQRFLARWRREYDHIIMDTPPVLGASDTVRLSASADAVILVVRADHTPREAFYRAQNALHRLNANLVGVVLNGVDMRSPEFSVQYGYHQGYWNSSQRTPGQQQ